MRSPQALSWPPRPTQPIDRMSILQSTESHLAIERCVLDFAHRDASRWDDLSRTFVQDAHIQNSWYSGPIEGFVHASIAMAASGRPNPKHLIGPPRIDIAGDRATAESNVTIMVRMNVPEGELDVTSWSRFYDLFRRVDGNWRINRRTVVYERDRIDPVALRPGYQMPAPSPDLPAECKHMAMLLRSVGKDLGDGTVVSSSGKEAEMYEQGRRWLEGDRQGATAKGTSTAAKAVQQAI